MMIKYLRIFSCSSADDLQKRINSKSAIGSQTKSQIEFVLWQLYKRLIRSSCIWLFCIRAKKLRPRLSDIVSKKSEAIFLLISLQLSSRFYPKGGLLTYCNFSRSHLPSTGSMPPKKSFIHVGQSNMSIRICIIETYDKKKKSYPQHERAKYVQKTK